MSSLAPVQQLEFHQGLKSNILDRTVVGASTATNLNDNDFHPSLCNDKKEKKSESANTPVIGNTPIRFSFYSVMCLQYYNNWYISCISSEHEIGSEDNTSLDIPESAGAATGGISGMMTAGSNHADDTGQLIINN